jgi:hypothetical protein
MGTQAALLNTRFRAAALSLAVLLLLIFCGYGVTHGYTSRLFMLVGLSLIVSLAFLQRGAFIGLLLVAAMNGMPFVNATKIVGAHATVQDLAVACVIGAGFVWAIVDRQTLVRKRIQRVMFWCGVALLAWWVFIVLRTSANGEVKFLSAANYGRDFVFFALLLMVLPRIKLSDKDLKIMIGTLGVAVCLFAVGQILKVLGFANLTWLVHAGTTNGLSLTFGLARVYAAMNDLVLAGLAAAIGALLLSREPRVRRVAWPVALLLGFSFLLELTRARWIGLIVALIAVSLRLMVKSDAGVTRILRKRLAFLIAGLVIGGLIAVLSSPHAVVSGPFVQRFLSFFSDLQANGSTITYRVQVIGNMTALLGGKWALGVGLIPPSAHWFGTLPAGSLRNSDVGVLNGVLTMGIVGTVLIYLPVVAVLIHALRRSAWSARTPSTRTPYPWLRYSAAIWIIATLASSASIVTLFSLSGLAMTAVILMLAIQPAVSGTDGDLFRRSRMTLAGTPPTIE